MNQAALERGQALVSKAYSGKQPKGYADMKQVFDDKDVAAVSMPLPNHWHALATIWACQAGKDVYIEKPACHNIWEGEQDGRGRAQVQPHGPGRQPGPQSMPHKIKAMQLLKDGAIGKLYDGPGPLLQGPRVDRTQA